VNAANFVTLYDVFAEYVRYGSFAGSINNYGDLSISVVSTHYIVDVLFFVSVFVMWNIVKGTNHRLLSLPSVRAIFTFAVSQVSHSTSLWKSDRSSWRA
jgi:hypothetical protein